MLGKAVLWVSAVIFVVYGLVCFLSPEVPAGYAGLELASGDAVAEVGAMYGGLQLGFGLFCAIAALHKEHYRSGLMLVTMCIGLLALGRLYTSLTGGQVIGPYTYGALGYEAVTAMLAGLALWRADRPS